MGTAAASWSTICHTLMRAQPEWWKTHNDNDVEDEGSFATAQQGHEFDDEYNRR
jgi:hypothetical protein